MTIPKASQPAALMIEQGLAERSRTVATQLRELLSQGLRGKAVELYQMDVVGIPAEVVAQLRNAPFRSSLEAIAQSLLYDATILGKMDLLASCLSSIVVPTLLMSGEASPAMLSDAAQAVADTLPHAQPNSPDCLSLPLVRHQTVPDPEQTHCVHLLDRLAACPWYLLWFCQN